MACARSLLAATLLLFCSSAAAQHEMHPPAEASQPPPGAHARQLSGTARGPESSPAYGWHLQLGERWTAMFHGNLFAGVSAQGSDRGATEATSINWLMAMLTGPAPGGELALRVMLSAEPWTVANGGYPLLLQTGESFEGMPLHDRQHPHDLFMELAASWAVDLGAGVAASLYAALPGEPAIGPPAYPHRTSALWNPAAPINHHWQDATHIAFGVITAGVETRRFRIEGSIFNGEEPDDRRTDIELEPLRSYAGRFQLALARDWSAQISLAHLEDPETLHPGEDAQRATASVLWTRQLAEDGVLALAAVWGANRLAGQTSNGALLEGTWVAPGERHVLFGRAEVVGKSGEELVLDEALHHDLFTLGQLTLGYVLEFPALGFLVPGVGASGTIGFLPASLDPWYGSRLPLGAFLFLHLRPPAMAHHRP